MTTLHDLRGGAWLLVASLGLGASGAAAGCSDERTQLAPAATGAPVAGAAADASDDRFDPDLFADPPRDYAPGVRWFWPGGAVDDATLEAEIIRLADTGYGMVEVQPFLAGIPEESVASDPRMRTVGEASFLDHVRTVARVTREHGIAFDLTLGSGWSNGGVGVPASAQEQQLLRARTDVTGPGRIDIALPPPKPPAFLQDFNELLSGITKQFDAFDTTVELEAVIAAPLLDPTATPPVLGAPVDLSDRVVNGRLVWDVPAGNHAVFALYRNRTAHLPVAPAYAGPAGAARLVDHLGSQGSQWVIAQQIDKWLGALGDDHPAHFFIDSFELAGELPWSPELATHYQTYLGRSPYVDTPFVFRSDGETKLTMLRPTEPVFTLAKPEDALRLREDYERVRAEMFSSRFLQPLMAATHAHGVDLRVQAHGGWGVTLDDYAAVDVPETESLYTGGPFEFLSLAAAGAHVAGRRLVSAESFVTINVAGVDALDLDALWLLAGRSYAGGVNRPVHSGVAYPFKLASGEQWYPMRLSTDSTAGGTLDIRPGSPSFAYLPAFNRAQARIGYALSRGAPRVDVAWLMTARETPDKAWFSVGALNMFAPESSQSSALRGASYTYDRISPNALRGATAADAGLRVGAARYRALLVDEARVIDPDVLATIEQLTAAGVPIVWAGAAPERAFGSVDAARRDASVTELWSRVRDRIARVADPADVPAALRNRGVLPEVEASGLTGMIGTLQRSTAGGRVIWLFNEGALPDVVWITLRVAASTVRWFDPETGLPTELPLQAGAGVQSVAVQLPASRGGILFVEPGE